MKSLYLIILLNILSSTIKADCFYSGTHQTAPGYCVVCAGGAVFSGKGCKCTDSNKKLVKDSERSGTEFFWGGNQVDYWECK